MLRECFGACVCVCARLRPLRSARLCIVNTINNDNWSVASGSSSSCARLKAHLYGETEILIRSPFGNNKTNTYDRAIIEPCRSDVRM